MTTETRDRTKTASARSKGTRSTARKDERRAYVRAVRREGKALCRAALG